MLNFKTKDEKRNSYFSPDLLRVKPQSSLEYLRLKFGTHDLMNAGLFEEEKAKSFVAHWEEIKELKALEFTLTCSKREEFNLMRIFTTEVLKKVQKLKKLKFWIGTTLAYDKSQNACEPFLVGKVPHLYETLERFEYHLTSWREDLLTKFDLETLMPFKNLRSLKLEGNIEISENVEELVGLLEGNQKEGEYSVLKFELWRLIDSPADWLREALRILERTKRAEKNLKVIIDLKLGLKGYMEALGELCDAINSVKIIKGLRLYLNLNAGHNYSQFPGDEIRELLNRYPGIRNLHVVLSNAIGGLEFIRLDGEKEQFFSDIY